METITSMFFFYLELLTSWWWLLLAGVTLVGTLAIVLRDDDGRLSLFKSVQLSFVGLVSLVPVVRNVASWKLRMDFVTRWSVLGLNTFWSFVLTIFTLSFLFAPIMFLLVFGVRLFDHVMSGPFGHDVGVYGAVNAVRLLFGADPESMEPKGW